MSVPRLPPAASAGAPYRLAFLCLGNICRSPTADVVMTALVDEAGLAAKVSVDSCGTGGWHVGQPMDARAADHLLAAGYDPTEHRGQQYDDGWRDRDLLLAMDAANLAAVSAGGETERVRLFRSFDPLVSGPAPDVPDPYRGGDDGFADVLAIVERTCRQLLAGLEALRL